MNVLGSQPLPAKASPPVIISVTNRRHTMRSGGLIAAAGLALLAASASADNTCVQVRFVIVTCVIVSSQLLDSDELHFYQMDITDYGSVTIELVDDQTPVTVANFLEYVDLDFYDGLIFHRVIDSFMIQGVGSKHL